MCSETVEVTHNDGGVGGGKVVARWVARWEFGD